MAKSKKIPPGPDLSTHTLPVRESPPIHDSRDQEQEIQYLKISDIFASVTNPRKHFEDGPIAELAHSIFKFGVIQPITCRPKKGMSDKYELVCGERRWMASKRAERSSIPAIVRDLTDDEVLDLQFTENLQRQDVHPMDEAVTFKAMIETNRYTISDIAAKVLKSEDFVVHRLSLNKLIPEFQNDFWAGYFLIGHAILFSRLTESDQKELKKRYGKQTEYDTLVRTKDFIDTHISRKLSAVPFKKDDATLVPAAGPCTTCTKRSGCNLVLFNDYKDNDRCFDKACFQKKMDAFLKEKVKATLDEKPDTLLVEYGYNEKLDPSIKKMAADMNVKILSYSSSEVQNYQSSGWVPIKALMVSGNEAGQMRTLYIKGKEKPGTKGGKPEKRTAKIVDEEIAGIQSRQARALELDAEKVWEQVVKLLEDPATLTGVKFESESTEQEERNAMAFALLDALSDPDYKSAAWKLMKMGDDEVPYMDLEEAQKIQKTTMAQLVGLLRLFFLEKCRTGLSHVVSDGPFMLMPVLSSPKYLLTDIVAIKKEQQGAIDKRIASAEKRIQKLKVEKAALPAPKEKAAKKAAAKKENKIAKGIKTLLEENEDDDLDDDE